jgi:CspA family cold shock protein
MPETFTMVIGAKRQVTLPARLLELLSLHEGSQIQIIVDGDNVSFVPLISVPRHLLPSSLLEEMAARRGMKTTDVSLEAIEAELESDTEAHQLKRPGLYKGKIKWFNNAKGYGFISRENGEEVFVHSSAIQVEDYKSLKEGDEVEFTVAESKSKTIEPQQGKSRERKRA